MWTNLIFDYSLLIMKVGIIVHMSLNTAPLIFVILTSYILICRLWDAEIVRLCYFEENIFELD